MNAGPIFTSNIQFLCSKWKYAFFFSLLIFKNYISMFCSSTCVTILLHYMWTGIPGLNIFTWNTQNASICCIRSVSLKIDLWSIPLLYPSHPFFLKSILLMLFFFSVPSDWFFKTKLSPSALKPQVVRYSHLWHTDSKTSTVTVVLIVSPITALMQNQGESFYREKPVNEEERLHAEKYWSLDSFNLQGSKLSDLHLLLNVCPSSKIT